MRYRYNKEMKNIGATHARFGKQSGFSLLEVMISLGLLGVGTFLFMTLQKNVSDMNRFTDRKSGIQTTTSLYQNILGGKENCNETMAFNLITPGTEINDGRRDITQIVSVNPADPSDRNIILNLGDTTANERVRGIFPGFRIRSIRIILPSHILEDSTVASQAMTSSIPHLEFEYEHTEQRNVEIEEDENPNPIITRKRIPLFAALEDGKTFQGCVSEQFQAAELVENFCASMNGTIDLVTGACQSQFAQINAACSASGQVPVPDPSNPTQMTCGEPPPALPDNCLIASTEIDEVTGKLKCVQKKDDADVNCGAHRRKILVDGTFKCQDDFNPDKYGCPEGEYFTGVTKDGKSCARIADTEFGKIAGPLEELIRAVPPGETLTWDQVQQWANRGPGGAAESCPANVDWNTICVTDTNYIGTDGRPCGKKFDCAATTNKCKSPAVVVTNETNKCVNGLKEMTLSCSPTNTEGDPQCQSGTLSCGAQGFTDSGSGLQKTVKKSCSEKTCVASALIRVERLPGKTESIETISFSLDEGQSMSKKVFASNLLQTQGPGTSRGVRRIECGEDPATYSNQSHIEVIGKCQDTNFSFTAEGFLCKLL